MPLRLLKIETFNLNKPIIPNYSNTSNLILKPEISNKIVTILNCAKKYNLEYKDILAFIDYSLPSSEKRLWIINWKTNKLLFNTYVSHGLHSGVLFSNVFSNNPNSKASSIGVYNSGKSYYGREGLSLRLTGLEKNFNDNASRRDVIMHGAWYVNENFIQKYGRAGRSWGCPAVPLYFANSIINILQNNSLFIIYYPDQRWLSTSKFLNCNRTSQISDKINQKEQKSTMANTIREEVVFVDVNNNNESDPILTITADNYQKLFHSKVPLERMLRRPINNTEYIALTPFELKILGSNNDKIQFVIATVKNHRGYFRTEMNILNLGKIKEIKLSIDAKTNKLMADSAVHFEDKPTVTLRTTNKFIRWLGL